MKMEASPYQFLAVPASPTRGNVTVFVTDLLRQAIAEQVPLQPVLVCYRDEHDALHPHAPFIGDDEFLDHAVDILKGDRMVVDVLVLPPVSPCERDARTLARALEAEMGAALSRLQRREP